MNTFTVEIYEGENWYGGVVNDGDKMPFCRESVYSFDFRTTNCVDQAATILLSDQGRYIRFEPIAFSVSEGKLIFAYSERPPRIQTGGTTLKDAYLAAYREYFFHEELKIPEECFKLPQFNDWMEIGYEQNQSDILKYAEEIISHGYSYCVLMIDDKWSDYYGSFEFNKARFPDAAAMIKKLREMGFQIMLWETPFISADSPEFRFLNERNMLVRNADNSVAVRKWWNGYSAVLDLSNPETVLWLKEKNEKLLRMGVGGFKFDGGDIGYYRNDDINFGNLDAEAQSHTYFDLGAQYTYNEFRSVINRSGRSAMFRQYDKVHRYGKGGLADVIPSAVMQNLMGYWYCAPDMVGGGSIDSDKVVDEELVIRFAQASALLPMMQFSRLPHRILNRDHFEICMKFAKLHCEFGGYICSLAHQAAATGEPIVRLLEYEFPHQGFEKELNAFALGEKVLVFPVLNKGEYRKKIRLPSGRWRFADGKVYTGGEERCFDTPLETLPYFIKEE